MSVVLVHGNPETTAVWDPLRAALDRHDGAVRLRGPSPSAVEELVARGRDQLAADGSRNSFLDRSLLEIAPLVP